MLSETTIQVLNRLVALHYRSLPMYLSYATPYWHQGDDRARQTLDQLVADQQAMVDRLGELIIDNEGAVNYGHFPMAFTSYHDLSFDFLLDRLLEYQGRDIAAIEQCVRELNDAPLAKAIAEEALGAAKAHLESLVELKRNSFPKAA